MFNQLVGINVVLYYLNDIFAMAGFDRTSQNLQAVTVGGVMLLPLGPHAGAQQLVRLTKDEGGIKREDLIGVRFVPLLPGKAREL